VISSLDQAPVDPVVDPQWTLSDSWIWARLQALIRDVERLFQTYQYGEAGRQIYDFFWGDFADWYLEIAKLQLAEGGDRAFYTAYTLVQVLDMCLRMLHPFTPFVTEEIWGYLKQACQVHSPRLSPGNGWPAALISAPWPEPREAEGWEEDKVVEFGLLQDIVRAIRNLRAEKNITPGKRIPAIIISETHAHTLRSQSRVIAALARIELNNLTVAEKLPSKPKGHIALVVGPVEIYLPLAGLADTSEERARLNKELSEVTSQIQRLQTLLTGPFAEKAPQAVVQREQEKLKQYQETAEKLRNQLAALDR
jgi:valyl-tRNA synthetase